MLSFCTLHLPIVVAWSILFFGHTAGNYTQLGEDRILWSAGACHVHHDRCTMHIADTRRLYKFYTGYLMLDIMCAVVSKLRHGQAYTAAGQMTFISTATCCLLPQTLAAGMGIYLSFMDLIRGQVQLPVAKTIEFCFCIEDDHLAVAERMIPSGLNRIIKIANRDSCKCNTHPFLALARASSVWLWG